MTPHIHPTLFTLSPVAGLFTAAAAFVLIAAAVTTQDVNITVSPQSETPVVSQAAYDPLHFSATVTAFDVVLADPLAIYDPARVTPYEAYINDITDAG